MHELRMTRKRHPTAVGYVSRPDARGCASAAKALRRQARRTQIDLVVVLAESPAAHHTDLCGRAWAASAVELITDAFAVTVLTDGSSADGDLDQLRRFRDELRVAGGALAFCDGTDLADQAPSSPRLRLDVACGRGRAEDRRTAVSAVSAIGTTAGTYLALLAVS